MRVRKKCSKGGLFALWKGFDLSPIWRCADCSTAARVQGVAGGFSPLFQSSSYLSALTQFHLFPLSSFEHKYIILVGLRRSQAGSKINGEASSRSLGLNLGVVAWKHSRRLESHNNAILRQPRNLSQSENYILKVCLPSRRNCE
jgi:hypothetical protein